MRALLKKVQGAGLLLLAGACTDDGNVVGKSPDDSGQPETTTSSNASASGTAHTGGTGDGGGTDGGAGGGGGDSTVSSGGGTQPQDTGAGGSSALLCGGDPRMQCAVDCDFFECGAPTSGFDEVGCLRDACIYDGDCPSGERCAFSPAGWDAAGAGGEASEVCVAVWTLCSPNENGNCSCGGGGECRGYCVPE